MPQFRSAAPALGALFLAVAAHAQGGSLTNSDKAYLRNEALSTAYANSLAEIAKAGAARGDVKGYAEDTITSYKLPISRLQHLALGLGVILPANPTAEQVAEARHLQGLRGPAFDQAYIADALSTTGAEVQANQQELSTTKNAQIQAYIQESQPTETKLRQRAEKLQLRE